MGLRPGPSTGPGLIPGSSPSCLWVIRMSPSCTQPALQLTSPCFVISQMPGSQPSRVGSRACLTCHLDPRITGLGPACKGSRSWLPYIKNEGNSYLLG